MSSIHLSSYSKQDLQEVLRIVRDYRSARKQIGNRAVLRDPRVKPAKQFRVVYACNADLDAIKKYTADILPRLFSDVVLDEVIYESDTELVWGVRIFHGDDLFDISFENFVQKF